MITMLSRSFVADSIAALARIVKLPRPVRYAASIPSRPAMYAPVGKSGPGTIFRISFSGASGLSISRIAASTISRKLCGGMFVAIPTAIPLAPLTRRFGMRDGSTTGSSRVWSKFGMKSTVSFSRSARMSSVIFASRASVYRIAAGGSPSTDPKFPCPSISG